jgi:hypothetical protein
MQVIAQRHPSWQGPVSGEIKSFLAATSAPVVSTGCEGRKGATDFAPADLRLILAAQRKLLMARDQCGIDADPDSVWNLVRVYRILQAVEGRA